MFTFSDHRGGFMTTSDPYGGPGSPEAPHSGQRPGVHPQPGRPGAAPPTAPGEAATAPRRRGSGLILVTLAVAVLALLLGVVAAGLSWRAVDQAGQALDRLNALPTAPPPPPPPPSTEAAPTDEPIEEPTAEPTGADGSAVVPELNAQTQYKQRYTDETLRVPATCGSTTAIDLDEPRVKVESSFAEFSHYDPCGSGAPYLNLGDRVEASLVASSIVTPVECAEQIRTSPVSSDNQPVRRGQVYCVKTSLDAARASAGTWKMVLVEVTATGQDGAVTFKATAWDIPA
jgi:hypothetical protein